MIGDHLGTNWERHGQHFSTSVFSGVLTGCHLGIDQVLLECHLGVTKVSLRCDLGVIFGEAYLCRVGSIWPFFHKSKKTWQR